MDQPNLVNLGEAMEGAAKALKEVATKFDMAQAELDKLPNLEPADVIPQYNQLLQVMAEMSKAIGDANQSIGVLSFGMVGQNQRIDGLHQEVNRLYVCLLSLFLGLSANLDIN